MFKKTRFFNTIESLILLKFGLVLKCTGNVSSALSIEIESKQASSSYAKENKYKLQGQTRTFWKKTHTAIFHQTSKTVLKTANNNAFFCQTNQFISFYSR